MWSELFAALCLVAVIEGLFLLVAPDHWKRMAEQMRQLDGRTLRIIGGGMVGVGLVLLQFVR
ncbi:DUF2065 domain-containing protein [Dokdonella sp.]|uniref:DUF2065 domain-containing protein n=1 Tax=Dokdonella sp. TaxID=2291710 RepID=UPI0031C74FA9|nr:DUF2065 family protein [Dokdonella sp.]